MSELSFRPVSPMLNCAVAVMSATVWPQGFDLSATAAPDSLRKLKAEYAARGRITVYSGDSDATIFDCAGTNHRFRAWHDFCHLALNADFSVAGEQAACDMQCTQIMARYGDGETGREMCDILRAEIMGQRLYFERHKAYVTQQRPFNAAYRANPVAALAQRW